MKILLGLLGLLVVAGGFVAILISRAEGQTGLVNGRLQPCPDRPNCVGSQEPAPDSRVEPIRHQASAQQAEQAIRRVMGELPRCRLAAESEQYLHFTVTTRWLRFVDDVEFLIDDQKKLIDLRSASRLGYSDLGVNRQRVEEIRRKLREAGISE